MTLQAEIALLMDRYGFSEVEARDFIRYCDMGAEFPNDALAIARDKALFGSAYSTLDGQHVSAGAVYFTLDGSCVASEHRTEVWTPETLKPQSAETEASGVNRG